MFEYWIELSHLIICYIGVYCGISIGIWLMVQAIDEVKRIRRKPVVKDCSIDWNYEALYKALKEDYNTLKTKYGVALQGEETLQKHFKELQETTKNMESKIKELEDENESLRYGNDECKDCDLLNEKDLKLAEKSNSIIYLQSECERFQRQVIDIKEEREAYRKKIIKIQNVCDGVSPLFEDFRMNRIKEILGEDE